MPKKQNSSNGVPTKRTSNSVKTLTEEPPLKRSTRLRNLQNSTKPQIQESKAVRKAPVAKRGRKQLNSEMVSNSDEEWKKANSVYDFSVKDINGQEVSLEKYKGHVLLIVNVASQCGLTATNYKELVELDEKYRESKGLRILAFPCNQFNNQEPGNAEDIVCFAKKKNATFDMFEKVEVNGNDAHPLWKYLKNKQGGTLGNKIKWNFTKFIVDKEGQPVERFAPTTAPHKLIDSLEKYF